ncbi:type II toxin-antitoxin system Phd/YefM family antitoxin [Sphingomonas bacterium]|uniref:type II toxin-antitoxin system Phd/YefM family antitoxin n=1 Tax=Sphingomonas bacterium TaxID=1895847 RepID=UPI001576BC21|nr:type II toxin-antitoxin system prevent-host-death family antitoxin [Sphingomonas bacterium]
MLTVNIHDAKTRLSELIARAVAGEPFIIAKAGKPMVKVEALAAAEQRKPNPIGFAKEWLVLPDGPGFPEDLPPDEQAELERLWHDGSIFPEDPRRDDAA